MFKIESDLSRTQRAQLFVPSQLALELGRAVVKVLRESERVAQDKGLKTLKVSTNCDLRRSFQVSVSSLMSPEAIKLSRKGIEMK